MTIIPNRNKVKIYDGNHILAMQAGCEPLPFLGTDYLDCRNHYSNEWGSTGRKDKILNPTHAPPGTLVKSLRAGTFDATPVTKGGEYFGS